MTRAVLAIGANLGDRFARLVEAAEAFADVLVAASDVYESPPWGDADQPAYLNAVLIVETDGSPPDLLARGAAAEDRAGRVRDPQRRFGPRPLDVDVIAAWSADGSPVVSDDPVLTLPHPRAQLRAFVLRPWLDCDPGAVLPGHGPVANLLDSAPVARDLESLVRVARLPWPAAEPSVRSANPASGHPDPNSDEANRMGQPGRPQPGADTVR
jgi:2-amino-4-hydroxy-6-hydroxymethyldihydropteridine diphosphokinase